MPMLVAIVSIFALCAVVVTDHHDAHRAKTMREFYRVEYQRCHPVGY